MAAQTAGGAEMESVLGRGGGRGGPGNLERLGEHHHHHHRQARQERVLAAPRAA